MGDIQACRVFKVSGVRELIEKYKPAFSFEKTEACRVIGNCSATTGKPDFEKFEDLYIEPRIHGTKLKPHDVFKYLVERGVFRVGLKLRCSNCELEFWQALDYVKTKTTCEYCGTKFDVTRQLSDRNWAYRRSGIFGNDDHQGGGVPVALTLQQLDSMSMLGENIYITGTNLKNMDATKGLIRDCEADFIMLSQHHNTGISIVIAECKANSKVTDIDVKNLANVADILERHGIHAYILFSKLSDFSEEEIQNIQSAQHEYLKRIILLTSRELEKWFIYEDDEKIYDIDMHAVSWADMAENTDRIFFQKRLKPLKHAGDS